MRKILDFGFMHYKDVYDDTCSYFNCIILTTYILHRTLKVKISRFEKKDVFACMCKYVLFLTHTGVCVVSWRLEWSDYNVEHRCRAWWSMQIAVKCLRIADEHFNFVFGSICIGFLSSLLHCGTNFCRV